MRSKHKRYRSPLTLIEIVIAMVLLGTLLVGLFNLFYTSSRSTASATRFKQALLQLELVDQRLTELFSQATSFYSSPYPEAQGESLVIRFHPPIENDWDRSQELSGILYLNRQGELCFSSWSTQKIARLDLLLDQVKTVSYRFFDQTEKKWVSQWTAGTKSMPALCEVIIHWHNQEIPFVFFPTQDKEQISYSEAL